MKKTHGPHLLAAAVASALTGFMPSIAGADSTAPADVAADMARCASVGSTAARLACYDALAGRSDAPPAAVPATTAGVNAAVAPVGAPAAARVTPPPASPPAAAQPDARSRFGLPAVAERTVGGDQQSITATITEVHQDRQGNVTVDLDNGQTWQLREPGASLDAGASVTIARGAIGSFVLTTPRKHVYHVHRIR